MPRIPIFRLGHQAERVVPPRLTSYIPSLSLQGLQVGVDNLRHDVYLSPRFVEQARQHISRLLIRHGDLEGPLGAAAPMKTRNQFIQSKLSTKPQAEPADLKTSLTELHVAALNSAKSEENPVLDLLARAAIIKFLRLELNSQFAQVLERCRMTLKGYEGFRHQKALEYRERVAAFQVAKKTILRRTGEELFRTLREVEKETLARTRRSFFGGSADEQYKLFLNTLIFSEDGSDAHLNAEYYVMLGNFECDPDRFVNVRKIACEFLQSLDLERGEDEQRRLDGWLNVPDNAQELVGGGIPDESTPEGRSQKMRLAEWLSLLERDRLLDHVIASYEVVPLLAEYSSRINAQQLKHALFSREERARVEKLMAEHGKMSPASLHAAIDRVAGYRGSERTKIAGRFLRDFMRYHRDRRQLEALNGALDSVNLASDKIRQLSGMNGTLYEFLLPEEQKSGEEKVVRHVIIKADVRDSSRLTRSLLERELNPASYFSLNFYDPVNKLLAKYGATKVFLEGDAIILALLEREGEPGLTVCRAAVLAREIVEIVRGYNQLLQRSGLPSLELGIGISYQDSPPMYLMDGEQRIMISDALNESDRLSSCSRRLRKTMPESQSPFHVYAFQTAGEAEMEDSPEDFILKYNVNGIRISEAAFQKLQQEISLEPCKLDFPELKAQGEYRLWSGLVPIGNDIFRKIVVRGSRLPQVDPRTFSRQHWTEHWYYEVASDPAIYSRLENKTTAGK
jgi:class 3 adenylate cyclase